MPRPRLPLLAAALAAASLFLAGGAAAQSNFDYTLGVLVGIGGATDDEPDGGYSNVVGEAFFAMETERHTFVGIRVGQLDLQPDEGGGLFDSTVRYVAATGGYRFQESFYESGIFLGLGAYDLDGELFVDDESGLGFLVGVDGDFRLSDHLSILGQVTAHWADFEHTQFLLTGMAGLAFHF